MCGIIGRNLIGLLDEGVDEEEEEEKNAERTLGL